MRFIDETSKGFVYPAEIRGRIDEDGDFAVEARVAGSLKEWTTIFFISRYDGAGFACHLPPDLIDTGFCVNKQDYLRIK